MTSAEGASILWPAERFYWSIIDVPVGARVRSGPLPLGLRPSFEDDVPQPLWDELASEGNGPGDGLHAVCTSMGRGRIVVCAAPVGDLKALDPALRTLCPGDLPEFILEELKRSLKDNGTDDSGMTALSSSLNLLVGEFEPLAIRNTRRQRSAVALLTILLCLGLTAVGLYRRAESDAALAAEAIARADEAARELGEGLGSSVRITTDTLPALLAVAQRAADTASRISVPADAAIALAALLEHWPREHAGEPSPGQVGPVPVTWACNVQSIVASGDSISLTLNVDGDAAAFLRVLQSPPGWITDEPRLNSVGLATPSGRRSKAATADQPPKTESLTRISITLRRSPGSAHAPTAAVGDAR